MRTVMIFNTCMEIQDDDYDECKALCSNYSDLNLHIMSMGEDQLLMCIAVEKNERNRANILNRLYARYSEIRKAYERRELMS